MELNKLLKNQLTHNRDNRDRERLVRLFSPLRSLSHSQYLCLRPYIQSCPERFFSITSYEHFFKFLETKEVKNKQSLISYLDESSTQIEGALVFLRQINAESWHDKLPTAGDEHELLRLIDRHIHPAYLRLVEAVFAPLAKIIAYYSRLDRGVGADGLDIWSIVQELLDGQFADLVEPYKHILRNGIAHGGITYRPNEITYTDKRGKTDTLSTNELVRLCDDLLDTCNGLAAALKVFLITRRASGYDMPQEMLLEELQEETQAPWWRIEGCMSTEISSGSQLVVYARPNSFDPNKINWSVIQSGLLAEFFAPGYSRYVISLNSPKALTGFAAFDGKKLEELRLEGTNSIEKYQGVIEDDLIFFVPKWKIPRVLLKMETLLQSFKLNMPLALEEYRKKLGLPEVNTRDAELHKNSWGCVLRGSVTINIEGLTGESVQAMIRKRKQRIVSNALSHAKANTGLLALTRYLPIGFARLRVFRKDYRLRRLSGFGLKQDLVCTIQFKRIRRIQSPDIFGSTVETEGNWRIAWNQAWLESLK